MEKESRKIPKKNYILFSILTLVTFLVLFYIIYYYFQQRNYDLNIPILYGYVDEIKENELNDYIRDNGNITIYMCKVSNEKCRNFERQFRKIIKKYNLKEEIVYLNIDEKSELTPGFLVYKERNLSNKLLINPGEEIICENVLKFLKNNGVL